MRDDARERVGGSSSRANASSRRRRRPPPANRARRGAIRPVSQRGDVRVANGVAPRRQRAASDASSSPRGQRASKANLRRQLAKRVARERGAPTRKRRPRVECPREAFAATRSDGVVGDARAFRREDRRGSPRADAASSESFVAKRRRRRDGSPRDERVATCSTFALHHRPIAESNRARVFGPRADRRASSPIGVQSRRAMGSTRALGVFAPRGETRSARSPRRRRSARLRHDARAHQRRRHVAPTNDALFHQTFLASSRASRREAFLPGGFRGESGRAAAPRARERTNEGDLRRRRAPGSKPRANVAVFRLTRVRGVAASSTRLVRGDATRGGDLRATRRRRQFTRRVAGRALVDRFAQRRGDVAQFASRASRRRVLLQ